uniref:Uncharacterized protein n=1 Tax=Rhizophagus irregularis (strain DAOM 181602 / DAOM 197198 / MUCL 43194) TaxID=747089 RepID=U9U236_RHIID
MEVMVYNQILLRAFKSANQFLFRVDYGGYGNFGGIGVFGDFDLHGCEETNSPALDEYLSLGNSDWLCSSIFFCNYQFGFCSRRIKNLSEYVPINICTQIILLNFANKIFDVNVCLREGKKLFLN